MAIRGLPSNTPKDLSRKLLMNSAGVSEWYVRISFVVCLARPESEERISLNFTNDNLKAKS